MKMMMLTTKDRRELKPFLVKFAVVLAVSFAGAVYNRIKAKRIKSSDSRHPRVSGSDRTGDYGGRFRIKDDLEPDMDSVPVDAYGKPCIRVRVDNAPPNGRYGRDKDGLLLLELDQLVREFSMTADNHVVTSPKRDMKTFKIQKEQRNLITSVERHTYEKEIEDLKRKIRLLQEKEIDLEVQLLEYYGLKEQETAMMELQSRLKINDVEAKLFSMQIESLQVENRRLEAQVTEHSKVVAELEAAKAKIKLLKKKIRHDAAEHKERILHLTHRVAKLHEQEEVASTRCSASDVQSELQRLKELEAESKELKISNKILQQENADLAQRLESTQLLAHAILEDPEKEKNDKERLCLREESENLAKEVERLKADRCADAEELVYLRWINACLRYELRNYQPPPGKEAARDLSKSLSPRSKQKAKQLILEYANSEDNGDKEPSSIVDFDLLSWPSSQPSYLTDSSGSPSPGQKQYTRKIKFFSKLRKLIRGKRETSRIPRSLSVDSFDSSVTLGPTILSQNSNGSPVGPQPLSSLEEEDSRDIEMSSDSTRSSPLDYRPKRKAKDEQTSELAKYAEVLRDTERLVMVQKSASIS